MKRALLAITLLTAFAGNANASELSYSFIEANYVNNGDFDLISVSDYDGFGLRGSIAFGERFYGVADYSNTSATFAGGIFNSDVDIYSAGVGYRHGLSDKADFFTDLSYARVDIDTDTLLPFSDDGYRLRVGVRGALTDKFEGTIGVTHLDLGDFGDDTALLLAGQFKFNDTWGITTDVEVGEYTRYQVGVRASF